jgi:hypothetical protein
MTYRDAASSSLGQTNRSQTDSRVSSNLRCLRTHVSHRGAPKQQDTTLRQEVDALRRVCRESEVPAGRYLPCWTCSEGGMP